MGQVNKKIRVSNGKEYVVQNIPVREAMRIRQESREGRNTNDIRWYEQMLEHVVIEPANLKIESFESVAELEELMEHVMNFVYGKK